VVLGFITDCEMQAMLNNDSALLNHLIETQRATRCDLPRHAVWVAAERLQEILLLHTNTPLEPEIVPLLDNKNNEFTFDDALREVTRSRLEGLGPVTVAKLAMDIALTEAQVQTALLALEHEGFAMRGQFSQQQTEQWCDRRLLARIHRYTIKSLRKEIKPVSSSGFMQFLFHWHHMDDKLESKDALLSIIEQLEGFSVPAAAWETDIFPARMSFYLPDWLDNLCSSGRVRWMRIQNNINSTSPAESKKSKSTPVSVTPIALMLRQNTLAWQPDSVFEPGNLPAGAKTLYKLLFNKGALFFDDLVQGSGMLASQVEIALGQLVANALVTSDSFVGLRSLVTPAKLRPGFGSRRRLNSNALTIEDAGRWTLIHNAASELQPEQTPQQQRITHVAKALLQRYGVVFRKLLEREAQLPSWRELLYVYRRMEARGEIRGGRFVDGFSGEQFALPEAVGLLRKSSQRSDSLHVVSAADPLNLTGIISPGERIASSNKNKIVYRNGMPVARTQAGQPVFLVTLDTDVQWQCRELLLRKQRPASIMRSPSDLL